MRARPPAHWASPFGRRPRPARTLPTRATRFPARMDLLEILPAVDVTSCRAAASGDTWRRSDFGMGQAGRAATPPCTIGSFSARTLSPSPFALVQSAEHRNNLRGPHAFCEDLVRFIALLARLARKLSFELCGSTALFGDSGDYASQQGVHRIGGLEDFRNIWSQDYGDGVLEASGIRIGPCLGPVEVVLSSHFIFHGVTTRARSVLHIRDTRGPKPLER